MSHRNNDIPKPNMSRRDIERQVALVTNGSAFEKTEAVRALGNLARVNAASRTAIGRAGGIPPLVALLTQGPNGGSAAVEALRNLAYNNPANKVAIVAAGAVGPLVALVRAGDRTASWALEQLDVAALASRLQTPQGEKASRMRRLEAPECVVCLERARAVAFLPCGHFCVCSNCGQRLDECPIYRVRARKQRIYT